MSENSLLTFQLGKDLEFAAYLQLGENIDSSIFEIVQTSTLEGMSKKYI